MELIHALPLWLQSGFWGLVSGSALLIGAAFGYFFKVPVKVIAMIMAFGSGVLISALSFDLMDEAYKKGGFVYACSGFLGGAILYSLANFVINKNGAKHRKRSGKQQQDEGGSGFAIAIGALLDGIPESIAIGLSMVAGGVVSTAAVVAVFLSNLPEGLSSSSGMKKAGRSSLYVFSLWGAIALLSAIAATVGYLISKNIAPEAEAVIVAIAAGAILAMLTATMIPEAFEKAHDFIGVVAVIGFLVAFLLTKME